MFRLIITICFFAVEIFARPSVGQCIVVEGKLAYVKSESFWFDSDIRSGCNLSSLGVYVLTDSYNGEVRYLGDCIPVDGKYNNVEYGAWKVEFDSDKCNPCENVPYLEEYDGLPLIATFDEMQDCQSYMLAHSPDKAYCIPANIFDPNTLCTKIYGYGKDPCEDIVPPLTYNGFPLVGKYPAFDWCVTAYESLSVDGLGACLQIDECDYTFGYFKRSDTNNTTENDPDRPDLPNDGPMPNPDENTKDNNLSMTDENNDSVDLNPLLEQNKDISDRLHQDIEKQTKELKTATKSMSDRLHSDLKELKKLLKSKGSKSNPLNVDVSGVEKRLDNIKNEMNTLLNPDNLPEIPEDPTSGFIENLQSDFETIQQNFEDAKNIVSNGFDPSALTLPAGINPEFESQVFGQTLKLSLCDSFSTFKPILMFIFMIIFYILAIRIFILAIRIL